MTRRPAVVLAAFSIVAGSTARASADTTIGVGVVGGYSASSLPKPSSTTLTAPDGSTFEDTTYPGFRGGGPTAGISLDVRFLPMLGVEIDALWAPRHGRGTLEINPGVQSYDVEIGQTEWHVPVLAKALLPLGFLAPFAVLGPELVVPATPTTSASPTPAFFVDAYASTHVVLTGGLGLEAKLPIPGIDLRVAASGRASLAPSVSSDLASREEAILSDHRVTEGRRYASAWKTEVGGLLGVSTHF